MLAALHLKRGRLSLPRMSDLRRSVELINVPAQVDSDVSAVGWDQVRRCACGVVLFVVGSLISILPDVGGIRYLYTLESKVCTALLLAGSSGPHASRSHAYFNPPPL